MVSRACSRLHRDEQGSLSIVSVFSLMMLVVLLGLVMNSSRQVDQKVKLQNAADASTYAGGIVLARGMNSLAFTNHLLADTFAITAYFREARDRNAESLVPPILDNWERVSEGFAGSEFPPFDRLGPAIADKVPHERDMVANFSEWAAAASEIMLPVFEEILAERMIPEFQRALVETTPELAQVAADELARRHGDAWPRPVTLRAQLWRTGVDPVGGTREEERRTLPVVDPVMDMEPRQDEYFDAAVDQRHSLSHRYLRAWNRETLEPFDVLGKMSQFGNLWRIFTCGQLEQLLEEYPDTNLPFQIRRDLSDAASQIGRNEVLEADYMFVGVVYGEPLDERLPGIFNNPSSPTTQAYSQIMVFVPRRRLVKVYYDPDAVGRGSNTLGGIPGENIELPGPATTPRPPDPDGEDEELQWYVARQSGNWHPTRWRDLLGQNWTMQLVPAMSPSIPEILSSQPYVNGLPEYPLPDLTSLTEEDLQWLSHH